MRRLLAPGILVAGILVIAMLGLAALTCDSGSVAKAEELRPVPYVQADWLMRDLQLLSEQNQRRYALPEFTSQSYFLRGPYETQREPPAGDFWTRDELRRYFGRP